MKAVLISIQPKWCELIASGKKTVEVRKTAPKLETPFKCYIYKTKKRILRDITHKGELDWVGQMADKTKIISCPDLDGGKVIGEFVCDKIDEYKNHFMAWRDKNGKQFNVGEFLSNACLTVDEVSNYISGAVWFYGWHISELKIYDKPKELREFRAPCNCSCLNCKNPLYDNGVCEERGTKKIIRPFQSWGYVEE